MREDNRHLEQDIPVENNFDLLRLVLALSVFCTHYDRIFGEYFINCPISISGSVSSFFVISGFLIYRSCLRSSSLKRFWVKRAKRILPAYVLIVLLSIFLFFPFSDRTLGEYFFSSDMLKYLGANLSTLNFLRVDLPGVMDGGSVNPSLWTIKIELFMYLLTPLFLLLFSDDRRWLSPLLVAMGSLATVLLRRQADMTGIETYDLFGKWGALMICYVAGVALYLYRELVERYKWPLFLASIALFFLPCDCAVDFCRPFLLAVLVYVLAFATPSIRMFKSLGDLSYGVYLYHGPIVYLTICMGWGISLPNFLLTLSFVLLFAFASWHLLEKKVLGR